MHVGLAGRHIAFLATDGVDEDELRVAWRLLEGAGAALALVAPEGESIRGSRPDASSGDMRVTCPLDVAREPDFDALGLPGGKSSAERLRTNSAAVKLVRDF